MYFFAFGGKMAAFKCKMCGGALEIQQGVTVVECDYCGATQTLPKLDDEKRANVSPRKPFTQK